MMFLVSGASGMGKSTVRGFLAEDLPSGFACIELEDVLPAPLHPDTRYRQQAAGAAVRRALELQAEGRDLVLASDPVAAGELLAVPEAEGLNGIAVCVLDADESVQRERLSDRGETEEALGHHAAFARWMRGHARDPQHMQHVLISGGLDGMHWERWTGLTAGDPRWGMVVIDTTLLDQAAAGHAVRQWIDDVRTGRAPVFGPRWWMQEDAAGQSAR